LDLDDCPEVGGLDKGDGRREDGIVYCCVENDVEVLIPVFGRVNEKPAFFRGRPSRVIPFSVLQNEQIREAGKGKVLETRASRELGADANLIGGDAISRYDAPSLAEEGVECAVDDMTGILSLIFVRIIGVSRPEFDEGLEDLLEVRFVWPVRTFEFFSIFGAYTPHRVHQLAKSKRSFRVDYEREGGPGTRSRHVKIETKAYHSRCKHTEVLGTPIQYIGVVLFQTVWETLDQQPLH